MLYFRIHEKQPKRVFVFRLSSGGRFWYTTAAGHMKTWLILFLSFFIAGCSNKYLVGYHYLGNNEFVPGMVSEKTEELSRPFEEKCIQTIITADMELFRSLFTEKLSKAVPEEDLVKLKEAMQNHYKPTRYQRLKATDQGGERLHAELDTDVLLNGFKHYDYIEALYLLYGASISVVHLYITEVEGNLRLSGFDLSDAYSRKKEKTFSIKYLVPETVDKAGLIGTTFIKFPE
jgi:hypothetical protein